MNRYTVRLCFRNQDTHTLLMVQEFTDKNGQPMQFNSILKAVKFMEDKVKGMKAVTLAPRIDIYGQVWLPEKDTCEYGIALF